MMSLVVKCGWHPPAGMEIQARIAQIARLLEREETIALMGGIWYRTGYSKRDALSKPLSLAKIGEARSWDRKKLIFEETGLELITYGLSAWNGRDLPNDVSLAVQLQEPPIEIDSISFGGPELELFKDKWRDVLAWADVVARHLGGLTEVTSFELMEWAEAQGLGPYNSAAYAVFDGRDGRSVVSAATWPEVIAPNKERVQKLIRMFETSPE